MEPTPEQKQAIERLYENESLTENLTDTDARALLSWAQEQIASNADDKLVQAAVSAANNSGEQGAQALLLSADTFLAQEVAARSNDSTATTTSAAPLPTAESTPEPAPDSDAPGLGTLSTDQAPLPLDVSGQAAEAAALSGKASSAVSPKSKRTGKAKKSRGKSKRRKK